MAVPALCAYDYKKERGVKGELLLSPAMGNTILSMNN
jgi:hypothetical protein